MPDPLAASPGRLPENIAHFARGLRKAGLPVGPARVVAAVAATEAAGFTSREDFFHTLQACLISKPEHRPLFAEAFRLFWRDPQVMERMMAMMLAETEIPPEERALRAAEQRAREAFQEDRPPPPPKPPAQEEIEFDATFAFSAQERLRARDFEQMSAAEIAEARRALEKLRLPAPKRLSRRLKADPRGARADWRATLRQSFRTGGLPLSLARRAPQPRPPSLVALCDVSGSMGAYSRMLLHFLHALSNRRMSAEGSDGWARVESFVFGTRLTRITRHLKGRDVDQALAAAGREAQDWEGGTRIGAALAAFNRLWARRLLGQGAVVLLITDGLDREDPAMLEKEAARLRRSCLKLVWLNPLLRWEGFAPKARGVRALLGQVDSFRAAHNIDSLEALAGALSRPDDSGEKERLTAMLAQDRDAERQAAETAAAEAGERR